MINTTSGRAVIILTIGLAIGVCSPSRAADPQPDAPAATTAADAPGAPASQAADAPDQLNATDRTPRQDSVRSTLSEPPAPRAAPVVAGSQNATWNETSLIGKIFIGFGALLTVASAARMFIA